MKIKKRDPMVRAFLFECTELPPYSDAVRAATGMPVWDAITACSGFMAGFRDNVRFGKQNWQKAWDGKWTTYNAEELSVNSKNALQFRKKK